MKLTVRRFAPEELEEDFVALRSVYDVSLVLEGLKEHPAVTLSFEIPEGMDPRCAVILQKTEEGWLVAENEGGLAGGEISPDGRHISIIRKQLSRFSVAEWLYLHIFRHLEKLPEPPPPDPKIEVKETKKDYLGNFVVKVDLDSPNAVTLDFPRVGRLGLGGTWYQIVVKGEEHIKAGGGYLAPGEKRVLEITFPSAGGDATVCLVTKGALPRAALNWASRLGLPKSEVEALVKIVERFRDRPAEWRDLIWVVKEALMHLIWKAVGAKVKFFVNLVPVSIDIAVYINALTDYRPDTCVEVSVEGETPTATPIPTLIPTLTPMPPTPTPIAPEPAPEGPAIEWERTFGGPDNDLGSSVQQTSDGGYIVAGMTSYYGAGGGDVWLIKTDSRGNLEWERTFGGLGPDKGSSVQQTSDGGYIVAGMTSYYGAGGGDVWLIKTDSRGNLEWERTFGGPDDDWGSSVQQTSDGGYIIAGVTESYGYGAGWEDVWLIKMDSRGNLEWERTFGGPYDDWGFSVQQTSDGGYVIASMTSSYEAGEEDVWLIKTDSQGNLEWERTFGGSDDDKGLSVQQTSDGGYVVAGMTFSYGAGGVDVWLIKTDLRGNLEWERTFGGPDDDWGSSVQQTSDGGYVVAGMTSYYGARGEDVWLIKLKGGEGGKGPDHTGLNHERGACEQIERI
jgi:hypothetical protein